MTLSVIICLTREFLDKMFELICLVLIYIIILFICIQHSLVVVVSLTLVLIFRLINDGNIDNTGLLCEVQDLKKKVEQLGSKINLPV